MKLTLEGIKNREAWEKAESHFLDMMLKKYQKSKKRAGMGSLWNRKYFSHFYWRHCGWSAGGRCPGQRHYLCGNV